jgi:hypothetical protein
MAEAFQRIVAKTQDNPVTSALAATSILGLAWYVLELVPKMNRQEVRAYAIAYANKWSQDLK